jgi:hypothetical protein
MKRISAALAVVALAVAATPATAAPGVPGTTFPEQPGSHVSTACAALMNHGGFLAGGLPGIVGDGVESDVAEAITGRNYLDACFNF